MHFSSRVRHASTVGGAAEGVELQLQLQFTAEEIDFYERRGVIDRSIVIFVVQVLLLPFPHSFLG